MYFVCTLLLQFMLKSSALRAGVKRLYNTVRRNVTGLYNGEQSQYSPALLLGEKLK